MVDLHDLHNLDDLDKTQLGDDAASANALNVSASAFVAQFVAWSKIYLHCICIHSWPLVPVTGHLESPFKAFQSSKVLRAAHGSKELI